MHDANIPCQNEGVEPGTCVSQHHHPRSVLVTYAVFPPECSPSYGYWARIEGLRSSLCNVNAGSHPGDHWRQACVKKGQLQPPQRCQWSTTFIKGMPEKNTILLKRSYNLLLKENSHTSHERQYVCYVPLRRSLHRAFLTRVARKPVA